MNARTPLLVIALAVLPWGLAGHWLVTGPVWLVIAALIGWRYRRRRSVGPPMDELHS